MRYLILRMWGRGKSLGSSSCESLYSFFVSFASIHAPFCEVLCGAI